MKRIIYTFSLFFLLVCSLFFYSCGSDSRAEKGLDVLYEHHGEIGDFELTGNLFITKEFMDKYPYKNGDFQYYWCEPNTFIGGVERTFVWLSYDAETYVQAKEAMLNDRLMENETLDGQTAFGFTFYLNHANLFPRWFRAFGYNDDAKTMVFIGLYVCFDDKDIEYCSYAETDLEAFIQHFYGEWYDWNSGAEADAPTGKTTDEITAEVM